MSADISKLMTMLAGEFNEFLPTVLRMLGGPERLREAMAYSLLGKLQQRSGKNTDAIASFKKCLELDPSGRLAAETKDTLKALESKKK